MLAARESPWWVLTVPELGIVTQARYWGEAELMARDLIAAWLDVPLKTVEVDLVRSSGPAGPPSSWWVHLSVWVEAARARITRRR